METTTARPTSVERLAGEPRVDVVTYLTIWLVLLFGINARQVVGLFGAIGSPALLFGMPALLLWSAGWILPESGLDRRAHPLRPVLLFYGWAILASYLIALSRPLTDLEHSGATRSLIVAAVLIGVSLLVADGVQSLHRLETLLGRLVAATAGLSLLGALQFFTGRELQFGLPGLAWNIELLAMTDRSIFHRPAGTTLHPIEFSVVTAAMVPLALHFVFHGRTREARRNFSVALVLIVLGVPLSVSRSGLLALMVGLVVASLAWSWRRRLQVALVALAAVPVLWMIIPGLVGTLVSLFSNTEHDPSIQARIDRSPRVMALIRERPWFGLGNGTWSVEDYFLVDNELWVTTLELGIVGALVTASLFALAIFLGVLIKHIPGVEEATGHLAHAIAAAITGFVVSFVTFDAFHYRILTGALFVLIGASGALWRLQDASRTFRTPQIRGRTSLI